MTSQPITNSANRALQRMTQLLELEHQARHAENSQQLAFIMVNESRVLINYRQALLWRADKNRLQAISGLAVIEDDAPFILWIKALCLDLQKQEDNLSKKQITVNDIPEKYQSQWQEYFPTYLLILPLQDADKQQQATLLLSSESTFYTQQQKRETQRFDPLLNFLVDAYAHAWFSLLKRKSVKSLPLLTSRTKVCSLIVVIALMFIPVRQSVTAPAQVVALSPTTLRSPVQGVVEKILVQPNQTVVLNQPLIQLDTRELENQLQSSLQSLAIADAEFRQAQQQALSDPRSKASLAVLQGRREQAQTEVDFLSNKRQRLQINATQPGIVLFDDANDWIGRPVSLGERIMQIAQPDLVQLEIQLPIADTIALDANAETLFFLNIDPVNPITGHLPYLAYRAQPSIDGTMIYKLKSKFAKHDERIRIGLKGSVKLYGARTTLFYYLLHKPLSALRIWLNF